MAQYPRRYSKAWRRSNGDAATCHRGLASVFRMTTESVASSFLTGRSGDARRADPPPAGLGGLTGQLAFAFVTLAHNCRVFLDVRSQQAGKRNMSSSRSKSYDAKTFAAGWIARNIDVGVFSWDDGPGYETAIDQFRTEAAQAGLSDAVLEDGLGPVPAFIANAYAAAVEKWLADQKRRPPHDSASV